MVYKDIHLIQFLDNLNIPLTEAERNSEIQDIPAISQYRLYNSALHSMRKLKLSNIITPSSLGGVQVLGLGGEVQFKRKCFLLKNMTLRYQEDPNLWSWVQ